MSDTPNPQISDVKQESSRVLTNHVILEGFWAADSHEYSNNHIAVKLDNDFNETAAINKIVKSLIISENNHGANVMYNIKEFNLKNNLDMSKDAVSDTETIDNVASRFKQFSNRLETQKFSNISKPDFDAVAQSALDAIAKELGVQALSMANDEGLGK